MRREIVNWLNFKLNSRLLPPQWSSTLYKNESQSERISSGVNSMAKLNKAPYLFLLLSVLSLKSLSVHGFFIDLETLGFSSSKDDGKEEASSVLISQPSEMQTTTVEVESKSDPNKSVRLTLEELKSLIMGSVKEIAANTNKPQPINIKISTEGRNRDALKEATTTQASSYSNNKYKYQTTEKYSSYAPAEMDDDSWSQTPSISYDTYSNEVTPSKATSEDSSSSTGGLLSAAKAVFRSPAHIMSSYSKTFNRWRAPKPPKKPKFKPGRRPLPDIVVQDYHDRRRRRKNPRRRPRPSQKRRPQRPQRVYYEDEYADSEYYDTRSRYGEAWDRMSFLPESTGSVSNTDYDSTLPADTPMNMSPPRPYMF